MTKACGIELVIPRNSNIMLVDDDLDLHFLVSRYFKRATETNASLISMYSGEECLSWIDNAIATYAKLPGMVLMDVNMPRLSGFECIKKIRERQPCLHIPIIVMLSSSANTKDIESAIDCGADRYMEKHQALSDIANTSIENPINCATEKWLSESG